jgi:hypothetical protein
MIYDELMKLDVIGPIERELTEGRLEIRDDGSIWQRRILSPNSPWVFKGVCLDRDSAKWLEIYFQFYRFIPKTCLSCWQIVLKPETLEGLFECWRIQQKLDLFARAGILGNGYQAIWFPPIAGGLEEARRWEKKIREKVKAAGIKGEFYLRRGCEEMERAAGPSDKWTLTAEAQRLEFMLDQVFTQPPDQTPQPSVHIIHVQKLWIEFAYRKGDPTVGKYMSSDKLPKSFVTYENSEHKPSDFPIYPAPWMAEEEKKIQLIGGEDGGV